MGRKAMDWAWSQTGLKGNAMLVLVCLADHHNDKTGQCNPKRERIAQRVGISERAVTDITNRLQSEGFIQKEERRNGSQQAATQYHLALESTRYQGEAPYTLKGSPQGEDTASFRVKSDWSLIEQKIERWRSDCEVIDDGDVAGRDWPPLRVIGGDSFD